MKNLEQTVYPSDERTILVDDHEDDYGGAHRYIAVNCLGFHDGKTKYDFNSTQVLQFVKKDPSGHVTPGLQSEQLALIMLDRLEKMNARYPSAQNEKQMRGLQMFLEGCKERVDERIQRGVMGQLAK